MQKKEKEGKGSSLLPAILVFGVVDVLCAAFLIFSLLQSPSRTGEEAAAETLPAFEENAAAYGNYDFDGTYAAANAVNYVSPTQPETIATVPEITVPETTTAATSDNPADVPTDNPCYGFIFPDSDEKLITTEQIDAYAYTKDLCQRAVSELFARYGYDFSNADTKAFFNQYSWYLNMTKTSDQDGIIARFTSVEKMNFDTLRAYEQAHGWG